MSDWEKEQEFWKEHSVPRFDLEDVGSGYMAYRDMVPSQEFGDWVRADDYRNKVEGLLKQIAELKAQLPEPVQPNSVAGTAEDYKRGYHDAFNKLGYRPTSVKYVDGYIKGKHDKNTYFED